MLALISSKRILNVWKRELMSMIEDLIDIMKKLMRYLEKGDDDR